MSSGPNNPISWCDRTWNPTRGCSIVSNGCRNCFAMKQAHRFSGPGQPYEGLTKPTKAGPQWTGKVQLVEKALTEPLSWRQPARVFVNSMSDLFHEAVPDEFIDRVFAVMALAPRHTFQILTKRAERMRDYFTSPRRIAALDDALLWAVAIAGRSRPCFQQDGYVEDWPLPNVHLGVSAEDQPRADERIPLLLQTPAAVRFVSAEPLIGPVDLRRVTCHDDHEVDALTGNGWTTSDRVWLGHPFGEPNVDRGIDWLIVGGESGPNARPCDVAWVRSIVEQCRSAGVPCFVKQLGSHVIDRNDAGFEGDPGDSWTPETRYDALTAQGWQGDPVRIRLRDRKGGDPSEWPEDLRVREFPQTEALMPG